VIREISDEPDLTLGFQFEARASRDDYDRLRDRFEEIFQSARDPVRLVIDITTLKSIEPGARWGDIKLNRQHASAVDRVAVIGDALQSSALIPIYI
jgi:hypothetical protein